MRVICGAVSFESGADQRTEKNCWRLTKNIAANEQSTAEPAKVVLW